MLVNEFIQIVIKNISSKFFNEYYPYKTKSNFLTIKFLSGSLKTGFMLSFIQNSIKLNELNVHFFVIKH